MAALSCRNLFLQHFRHRHMMANRHWNPKWKKERTAKFIKIDLPDFDEERADEANLTPDRLRSHMKKLDIQPSRQWRERPIFFGCSSDVFDPYVPPEGDGKSAKLSLAKPKEIGTNLVHKGRDSLARRKIRKMLEGEFDEKKFPEEARHIFINAHKALQERDESQLMEYVTESAFPLMWNELKLRTFIWEWVETLNPPKIVHVRAVETSRGSDDWFGQITVRFFSKQILAVYDQFGRLMLGDRDIPRDVLEYVVFENFLSLQSGKWRLHDKIKPDWMPKKQAIYNTYQQDEIRQDVIDKGDDKVDDMNVLEDEPTDKLTVKS